MFSGFLGSFFCQGRAFTLSRSESLELARCLFPGLLAASCAACKPSAMQRVQCAWGRCVGGGPGAYVGEQKPHSNSVPYALAPGYAFS